ncbi:MAG: hypothetical protein A2Y10_11700 [Planctomycetes bacterium GWF2_41_51]|nr:MAG: hypothetical protein A2Y10_11700 [Planctomycetes bacterium GWF2_41_51]
MRVKLPRTLWLVQWHLIFVSLMILTVILWIIGGATDYLQDLYLVPLMVAAGVGIFAIILLLYQALQILTNQQQLLERISDGLAVSRSMFEQISQGVKLSEAAKTIAYRDMDNQYLRASVMEKLHQQDYKATYAMIDAISQRSEYKALAEELKVAADNYRDSTEQGKINQIISYIEKLIEQFQWATASVQIESLVRNYPDSEKAKSLRQKLADKKEQRKRQLLAAWDEAVKREDTDRSLIILKELDVYLTPSEGLALQEAASEVFKNKLHNLGVRFSLAVSEKRWTEALQTGHDIIRGFPNSRMAEEIRGKLATLRNLAKNKPEEPKS